MSQNPRAIINDTPYLFSAPRGTLIYSTDPGVEYTKVDSEGIPLYVGLRIFHVLEASTGLPTANMALVHPASSAEGSVKWGQEIEGRVAASTVHFESKEVEDAHMMAVGYFQMGNFIAANNAIRETYTGFLGQEARISERPVPTHRDTVELGDRGVESEGIEIRPCSALTDGNVWEPGWVCGRAMSGQQVSPSDAQSRCDRYLSNLASAFQHSQMPHIENTGSRAQVWEALTDQLERRNAMLRGTIATSTQNTVGPSVKKERKHWWTKSSGQKEKKAR